MYNPVLSWTFPDVIGVDAPGSRDLERRFSDLLPYPVQGAWYSLSYVQEAGWFHDSMYFIDGDRGGAQHAFCWSLSDCNGDIKNHIWRVYWNLQCEPVLQLYQEFLHDGSSCLRAGEYLFHTQLGQRGVWKALKLSNPFGPSYVAMNLYPAFQPDWFKFGTTIFMANSIPPAAQPPIYAQLDPAYRVASNPSSTIPDPSGCVDPADMYFGHISTPSPGNSDTLSDAFADVSGSDTSEAEMVTWGSGRFFCINEAGEVVMILPKRLKSREAVKAFVTDALNSGEIDKSVRHVKCSRCKDKKAAKLWEIKPSNLERHICTHFGIKCYKCIAPYCKTEFTTKDQRKKHIEKKHPALAEPSAKRNGRSGRGRGVASGRMQGKHMTFPRVVADLPTGEMRMWVPDTAAQAIRAQTLTTLDDDYEI